MELSLDDIRKIEINILNYIKKICNENNIKYYLYAGTLAGAIDYNNFLPTDNDIDIVLLRTDYEKLLSILEKQNEYLLLTPYNNKDYYYPFAKLVDKNTKIVESSRTQINDLGVYVDIFPMDNIPDYFKKIYLFKMRIYKLLLLTKILSKPKVNSLFHLYYLFKYYIMMFIDYMMKNKDNNYFALLIDDKSKKYNFKDSKYISLVNYGSRNNNYILKSEFIIQKEYLFCHNYYTGTKNAKNLLNKIYNNKKIEKRSRNHKIVAFYR